MRRFFGDLSLSASHRFKPFTHLRSAVYDHRLLVSFFRLGKMSKLKLHEVCYFTAEHSKHKVRNLLDSSGKWTSPGKDFNSRHLIHNFRKAFNDKRRRQERISIRKLLVQFMRLCWGRISVPVIIYRLFQSICLKE